MKTAQFDPFCQEHSIFTVYFLDEFYGREGFAIFKGSSLASSTLPEDVDVKGVINGTWGDRGRWTVRYMNVESRDAEAALRRIMAAHERGDFLPWKNG